MLAQGGHHGRRVLAGNLQQHAETRTTLDQRGHVAVARPAQQVALPIAGNSTIFHFRRSFPDGNGINDSSLGVPAHAGVPRAADPPLGSQVLNQLLFQRSGGTAKDPLLQLAFVRKSRTKHASMKTHVEANANA